MKQPTLPLGAVNPVNSCTSRLAAQQQSWSMGQVRPRPLGLGLRGGGLGAHGLRLHSVEFVPKSEGGIADAIAAITVKKRLTR
jgi:hypothetical protein